MHLLCEISLNRIPTPVLEEYVKTNRQVGVKRLEILLRAFLELYQEMPLKIHARELNGFDSYLRLGEI